MATKALSGRTVKGSNAQPRSGRTTSATRDALRSAPATSLSTAPATVTNTTDSGATRNRKATAMPATGPKSAVERTAEAASGPAKDQPIVGKDTTASPLAPR